MGQDQNSKILQQYCPLVKFLSEILGSHCEVVLHDYADPDHSIIAIENGYLSGRSVGGPVSDMGMRRLKDRKSQVYIANYMSTAATGRNFRSASYAIRNFDQEVIGSLCVNIDIAYFEKAAEFLSFFTHIAPVEHDTKQDAMTMLPSYSKPIEKLNTSISDAVGGALNAIVTRMDIDAAHLTPKEKQHIVKQLNEEGVFILKGAVAEVAKNLSISEPTVYRYLKSTRDSI